MKPSVQHSETPKARFRIVEPQIGNDLSVIPIHEGHITKIDAVLREIGPALSLVPLDRNHDFM